MAPAGGGKGVGGGKLSEWDLRLRDTADELLCKNFLESRYAIEGSRRVEIFRGKDFYKLFRQNPERINEVVPNNNKSKTIDEQVADLGLLFMKKGFFSKSERLYKKPHPRREKLTKWPRKVFAVQDKSSFPESSFYTWKHQRPPTPWIWVGGWLLILFTLGCCLFPLAPMQAKRAVFHTSLTILLVLVGTVSARLALYSVIWTVLGKHVWLIPNLFSDHVPITDIFSPIIAESKDKDGKPFPVPHWQKRAGAVAAVASLLAGLYRVAPDKGYGAKIRDTHDDVLDFLLEKGSYLQKIGSETAMEAPKEDPKEDPKETVDHGEL